MYATAFDNYAKETVKLFVSLYAWYYMPARLHKVLIHGSAIVSAALLPIGQLSEEAQEARNKDIKKIQRTLYRKVIEKIDQSEFNAKADVNVGSCDLFVKGTIEEIKRITSFSSPCPSLTFGASASISATVINPSDSEYSSSTE